MKAQNLQIVIVLSNRILMYCSIDTQNTCKFAYKAYFNKSNPIVHITNTVVKQKKVKKSQIVLVSRQTVM